MSKHGVSIARRAAPWMLPFWAACAEQAGAGGLEGEPDGAAPTPGDDAAAPEPDAGPDATPPRPRGTVPAADPAPADPDVWMIALVGSDQADAAVLSALEDGSFACPAAGRDERGLNWFPVRSPAEPDDAWFGPFGAGAVWAVACLSLDAPAGIVVQADRVAGVWGNGARQPGDVYAHGWMRVPVVGRKGDNLIAVRGGAREFRARLWTTPDEAHLNAEDLTRPDLVEDDASEQWLGVPLLNLTDRAALDLRAEVVESDLFEATSVAFPALSAAASTQVGFLLRPKAAWPEYVAPEEGEEPPAFPVRLRIDSPSFERIYERELRLPLAAADAPRRVTFRDRTDGSVQYYGVHPPAGFDPERDYGLILSLHGAGVDGIGQAGAYAAKEWAYVVAPTNRRPFGFDWEEWGRLNALAALDDAMARYRIDPERVYLTGHSMGGHGTWHVGVTTPGRFAVIAPSAGWESFFSYTSNVSCGDEARPSGPFGRARAHSDTLRYLSNVARRGVYVIHGERDDNVPPCHGRNLSEAARQYTGDVVYYEEPGAGHWWDYPDTPGSDCVDWPPLMEFFQAHRLDPAETGFAFTSASPSYNPSHSFLTLESALDPLADAAVTSSRRGDVVHLATDNVRSLRIDGAALRARGARGLTVDGRSHHVPDGDLWIGPREGKRADRYGPFNQVFRGPFCFVYPDGGQAESRYVAWLVSLWTNIGNGTACALPVSRLTAAVRREHNLVYVGLPADAIGDPDVPFEWDGSIRFRAIDREDAGLLFVFPEGPRLSALLATGPGHERLLYTIQPFGSRNGLPDFLLWTYNGQGLAFGLFDADWRFDPALAQP